MIDSMSDAGGDGEKSYPESIVEDKNNDTVGKIVHISRAFIE